MYTNTDVITVASTDRRTPLDELNMNTSKHATPGNASCGTAERPRKSERATNKDKGKSEHEQKDKCLRQMLETMLETFPLVAFLY